MIDETMQLVYKYMLSGDEGWLIILLMREDGPRIAYKHFSSALRNKCIDLIVNDSHLIKHFENIGYLDKLDKPTYKKGCFRRIK